MGVKPSPAPGINTRADFTGPINVTRAHASQLIEQGTPVRTAGCIDVDAGLSPGSRTMSTQLGGTRGGVAAATGVRTATLAELQRGNIIEAVPRIRY